MMRRAAIVANILFRRFADLVVPII